MKFFAILLIFCVEVQEIYSGGPDFNCPSLQSLTPIWINACEETPGRIENYGKDLNDAEALMYAREEERKGVLAKAEEAAQNAVDYPGQSEFYLKARVSFLNNAERLWDEIEQMWCDLIRLNGELKELIRLFSEECNPT